MAIPRLRQNMTMNAFSGKNMASPEWQDFLGALRALIGSKTEKIKLQLRAIASRPLSIFDSTRNISTTELNSWFFHMRTLAIFALMAGCFLFWRIDIISSEAWRTFIFIALPYLAANFFWFSVSKKARLSSLALHAQLILDLIFFTAIIYHFGSSHDELAFLYILNIMSAAFISAFAASMSVITVVFIYIVLAYAINDFANVPHVIAFIVTAIAIAFQSNFFISRLRKKEEDACRVKDAFLGMAMHQLRNPLAAESLLLNAVEGEGKSKKLLPEQIRAIHMAKKVNENVGEFIRDFSVISKTEENLEKLNFEEISPFLVLRDIVREVRIAPSKKITLRCEFPEELEALRIQTIPSFFRQIFQNIISNAVSYSHYRGRVEITAERKDGSLIFTCRDEGIGIPEQDRAGIFGPFYRGTNAKKKEEGTGLGLFIVKRFTDLLGYEVWFDSSPQGTAFYVSVPV